MTDASLPLFLAGDDLWRRDPDGNAARFDPWRLTWAPGDDMPDGAHPVDPVAAVAGLSGRLRGVPVGIIGPREPAPGQEAIAEELGRRLAESGFTILCGGKNGVMEAACRGALAGGGRPIGLVPDEEWQAANDFVAIPIASGIGPARNAIIARGCFALIAVGGGNGTISEIAFGLQFKRLVLGLAQPPAVPGLIVCADVEEALVHVCLRLLTLPSA